jgi:DNA-binding MarR family transcriptional regulator
MNVVGVVEWRVLSYLAIMNIWRGVTADMVGGALALRENDLNETLQRLKEQKLVEAVPGEGTEQLFITEQGKKALRK